MADLSADRLASLTEQITTARTKRNLTRVACAKEIGITRMTLRAIEQGRGQQPTQETLTKVARFLRVPVEHLTGEKAGALDLAGTQLRSEDQQIAREFHHAATEVKLALKQFFSAAITDDQRERFARILHRLQNVNPNDPVIASIESLLESAHPPDGQVIPKVEARRSGKTS